jgi:uncharacterized protein (DUF488 family)
VIFSLGHSTHPFERFVALVKDADIGTICDVRRFPQSRRNPHFSRERLAQELPKRGIAYVWLGEELGGFREEGYDEWMRTPDFQRGIEAIERLAETHTVAIMCSEGSPSKCHRRFVSRALFERGHDVSHLLPDGSSVPEDPQQALPVL